MDLSWGSVLLSTVVNVNRWFSPLHMSHFHWVFRSQSPKVSIWCWRGAKSYPSPLVFFLPFYSLDPTAAAKCQPPCRKEESEYSLHRWLATVGLCNTEQTNNNRRRRNVITVSGKRQTPCGSHQRVCRAEIANISSLWFPSHLWSEANLSVRKAVSWSKPSEGWRDTAKTANIKFSGQITPFDLKWIEMLVLENPLHFSRYSWRDVSIASGLW